MVDYSVIDYPTGLPASELTDWFNDHGVDGWRLNSLDVTRQNQRRAIFIQGGGVVEYLIVDYDTGLPPETLESDLDGYGVDGWSLAQVDMLVQNKRRAILMKAPPPSGGTGGGIEEAPLDGTTYGRRNGIWNPALAKSSDVLDGGSF